MLRSSIAFWLLLAAAALAYLPGLQGELMFDDKANLQLVHRWLAGDIGWWHAVFGNESGPLGRPLAMASFLANAAIDGLSVRGLKLGNVLIHLLIGALLYLLLCRLAACDRVLSRHGNWAAMVVTAIWLLHPLHTGTVLYVVQRMAMLSALFTVLAMLAYLHGRMHVEAGRLTTGKLWLFAGVPTVTILAAMSKENGLLAPFLCVVLELVYFAPQAGQQRQPAARWFLWMIAGLPIAAGLLLLIVRPEFILDGYANRPFGPGERLLTQGRVLFDYIGSLLLPAGSEFSLYRDDYTISTSLIRPLTTLWAWVGWLVLGALAVVWRRRIPGFSAGIGIFIVGHAMESTIFPLLIYFEHRNYLPSIGILWAVASLLVVAADKLAAHMDHARQVFATAVLALLAVLAAATYARALVWQSPELLVTQSLEHYPDSRFMRMKMANIEMNRILPDPGAARAHYEYLLSSPRSSTKMLGVLGLMAIDCFSEQETKIERVDRAFSIQPETIEADLLSAIEDLSDIVMRHDCINLSASELATRIVQILDNSHLPEHARSIWRLRFRAARLYYHAGDNEQALEQAERAWANGAAELPVGMMIAGLRITVGDYQAAESMLDEIEPRLPESDKIGWALLEQYRTTIYQEFSSKNMN